MKLRLSKKKSIIITSIFFAILAGAGGYLLWRVNNEETLAEVPGLASNCYVRCITSGGVVDSTGCANDPESCAGYGDGGGEMCRYETICEAEAPEVCGNGVCVSSVENVTSCPADCSVCGDNKCTGPETLTSCPGDCVKCGDNICTSPTETSANCLNDCSKCGDGICNTLTETSNTCASDCACKAMVWGNKPSGSYKPNVVTSLSPITITNPNMTGAVNKGISIKLNDTVLAQCGSSTGASCYTLSANSTNQQLISLTLFGGQATIADGTYAISVTLPGTGGSCVESTSFTIAADAIVVNEEVPDTGLFDGVMSKIYLGTGFVFLGIMTTQFSKFGYLFNTIGERNRVVLEEKKRKREADKRNRFERRFK